MAEQLDGVVEKGHEAEIHVQLLMAVKQGEANFKKVIRKTEQNAPQRNIQLGQSRGKLGQ
jgi:hypothetical protein